MINYARCRTLVLGFCGSLILLPALSGAAARPRVIETIGIGRVDPALTNETQRQSTAREAAILEAQAKMLSIIGGLRLDGTTLNPDAVRSGILQGAEVVRTEWITDGQCRVTLRLDKNRYEALTGERLLH